MSDHVHSAACCRLTIRTEEPLLLASVGCLVCGRDTTQPVKLMRYGGLVMTDGCEVCKPEPATDEAEPVGASAGNYATSTVMRRMDGSIEVDQCGGCVPGVTA